MKKHFKVISILMVFVLLALTSMLAPKKMMPVPREERQAGKM